MPIRFVSEITDGLPAADPAERDRIVSNGLTRIGKRFKKRTVDAMALGAARTGRLYRRKGITGATRSHRASARYEKPAVDTGNLIRSVEDVKISATSHEVFVDDGKAPYGKWLEDPLERPIMSDQDIAQFEATEMAEEIDRMQKELFGE